MRIKFKCFSGFLQLLYPLCILRFTFMASVILQSFRMILFYKIGTKAYIPTLLLRTQEAI